MHDQPVHHTPDHFVSLGLAFPEQSRETPLKVWGHDHDGAYRQLPLHDPREACVLLRTPFGPALWSHNVLLFGSAASVWSYSRFGDVLVACSRTTVLSPALHYVDDYGSMEDQSSADSSFRAFEDYSGCLEISMKPSKRKPPETHHGIQGVLISSDAENLVLTPCPARIKAMSQQIDKRLHTNQLTPAEARKMAGKCNFQSRAPLWQSWPRGTLCQSLYRPGDDDLPTWDSTTRRRTSRTGVRYTTLRTSRVDSLLSYFQAFFRPSLRLPARSLRSDLGSFGFRTLVRQFLHTVL